MRLLCLLGFHAWTWDRFLNVHWMVESCACGEYRCRQVAPWE